MKIAVITGGHPFEVQPFHALFHSFPGMETYIQHTDEFSSEPDEVRDSYDAVIFYSMFRDTPQDNGPWYAGKPKAAIERLGEKGQGLVILHHGLLAYSDWAAWDEITGMSARQMRSYHPDEQVNIEISDPQHPIAQGLAPWAMIDETYVLDESSLPTAAPGNQVFLTTNHPRSIKPIGWTRQYRQARVFCFASGHGHATYANPGFQKALANGILWTAHF